MKYILMSNFTKSTILAKKWGISYQFFENETSSTIMLAPTTFFNMICKITLTIM